MPESLHLEFACTAAERKQAQELLLRRQLGGGSKVLTTIVLLLMLAGMLLGFYARTQREVAPAHRPYVYAAVSGVALVAWFWIRRSRAATPAETHLDVSDDGLSVRGPGGDIRLPWSAFSRLLESPDLFVLVDRPKTTLLVIPRRAFPSESWQDWFHSLATNRLNLADGPPGDVPAVRSSDAGDTVRLRVRLRYRDFLDRTLNSWLPRIFLAGVAALVIGVAIHAGANPPPNAVFSAAQVFFLFVPPFLLLQGMVVVLVHSVPPWWKHSRSAGPQDLSFSPESIDFSGVDGSGTLLWSAYDRFKETRWSFLLWNARTSAWLMLPKRAFASDEDRRRCRDLLSQHLRPSRRYFG